MQSLISNIQKAINKFHNGYCLLITLTNYNALHYILNQNEQQEPFHSDQGIRSTGGQEICRAYEGGESHIVMSDQYITSHSLDIISNFIQICDNILNATKIEWQRYSIHNQYIVMLDTTDQKSVRQIINDIYYKSQFYINEKVPEGYINCRFVSRKFAINTKAIELYRSLINLALYTHSYHHEYNYDSELLLKNISENNNKLYYARKAFAHNDFLFEYQPIIDAKNYQVEYYECLLRIMDSKGHTINSADIIKRAEANGFINIIDCKVFEKAIYLLEQNKDIKLSINISNHGVLNQHLLRTAQKFLSKYKVGNRLLFEITETTLNHSYIKTQEFIESLSIFGCKFALDDFGSGFTNFHHLESLKISLVKISGDYIQKLNKDEYYRYFVKMLVELCQKLQIKTVAEFVEDVKTAECLQGFNIDYMQGKLFEQYCES